MTKLAGVTIQKNTRGEATHVTFNMKKHKQIIEPILLSMDEKKKFEKMRAEGTSVEELRKYMHTKMEALWKK